MASKKNIVISFLGTHLDFNTKASRGAHWRPSVALAKQPGLTFDHYDILYNVGFEDLLGVVAEDIKTASPTTNVVSHLLPITNPWDFKEVYYKLLKFALAYPFDTAVADYYFHITTGSHVIQFCLCKLVEEKFLPGRLIQTSPFSNGKKNAESELPIDRSIGVHQVIDLDVSMYADIADELLSKISKNTSFLKAGIETNNEAFNILVSEIEAVASSSPRTMLLGGPTGAGKTRLAKRIFQLMSSSGHVKGAFVAVNCATLRGDTAMSTLFGHVRGAFTGALADRKGLLEEANGGLLFLDEVGELGADEQAALLLAIEDGTFRPVGSDREKKSSFQLICGTNRDLALEVAEGRFREDLLARINLWSFELPGLAERREDIEPNLDYELSEAQARLGRRITMAPAARKAYLEFALSKDAVWLGNFRDLNGSVVRMATLAGKSGQITQEGVEKETKRLTKSWQTPVAKAPRGRSPAEPLAPETASGVDDGASLLISLLGEERTGALSPFERNSLLYVLAEAKRHVSLTAAGAAIYGKQKNDADRLRKYLLSFGIDPKMTLKSRF